MASRGAFDGLRVVDFTVGMAGGLAGMILCDNGAEVIKIEAPGGDPWRASPAFAMWHRGKRSLVLDLARSEDQITARELAVGADIVLESFEPGRCTDVGLDYEALAAARQELVYCSISAFGRVARCEWLGADEALVSAKCGRMSGNDVLSGSHFPDRPIYIAAPSNSFGAAMLAVQGIAGAVIGVHRSGRGQRVETSILDGLSAATMRLAFERQGDSVVTAAERGSKASLVQRGIKLTFLTAQCQDGRYIQMCARQDHHFRNWLRALDLEQLLEDPRFAGAPLGFRSLEDADELERRLRARMREKPQAEWMRIFRDEHDVGADPFLEFDEFLSHPQMVTNERVVTVADPQRGPVTQIGPLAQLSETPSAIRASAPPLDEARSGLSSLMATRRPGIEVAPGASESALQSPPLEPFTIIEVAQFLAAPLGTTMLAELGARVVKVEPLAGDSFRRAGLEFVHIIRGKESLAVDLKTEQGRQILEGWVRRADALIHNFRPGVAERLGMGYEDLKAMNPRLVYLFASSYGSRGPESHRAAFHSTPNALSGGGILQAGVGNAPIDDSYPDPVAGLAAGTAMAIGLVARERFGLGQYIETTMLTATGYVHSERLTRYRDVPALPLVDREQRGLDALYRLYRCRRGWVFLAARDEAHWLALLKATEREDLLHDPRFASGEARHDHDAALTSALDDVFCQRDAPEWERIMCEASVPMVAVAESFEQFAVDSDLVVSEHHDGFGSYWRLRPRVRFSTSPSREGRPCVVGEHTRALLGEIDMSDHDIDALAAARVVRVANSTST